MTTAPSVSTDVAGLHRAILRAVESLASANTLDALLNSFLQSALSVTGAAGGAILDRTGDTEFRVRSLSSDGVLLDPLSYPDPTAFGRAALRDDLGILRRTADGESFCYAITEQMSDWFPEAWNFHARRGHRWACHYPFRVEGRVTGFLALIYRGEPAELESETIRSLAAHASWALEAIRLGRRDTEEALRRRAEELARANAALRLSSDQMCSLAGLDKFLQHVLTSCVDISGAEGGIIAVRDSADGTFRELSQIGSARSCLGSLARGEWLPIAGAPGCYRYHFDGSEFHMRAAMHGRGQKLGYIGLVFPTNAQPSEVTLELIRVLANQAGLAIQMSALARDAEQTAIAQEQERAAQRRALELEQANAAITRTTRWLTSLDEVRPFLEGVLRESIGSCGAVSGAIVLGRPVDEVSQTAACILRGQPYDGPLPQCRIWQDLRDGRRTVWIDYVGDGRPAFKELAEFHSQHGHGLVAAIPLHHDDEVIGYMGMAFDRDHRDPQSTANLEICQTLAQHATLAVRLRELADRARDVALAQERERVAEARAAELSESAAALRRTGSHLTQGLNLTAFVEEVLREAKDQTQAKSALLFAWDPAQDTLLRIDGPEQSPAPRPVPEEWKAQWNRLVSGEPLVSACSQTGVAEYALAVPVLLGTRLLGFLCLKFDGACPGSCKIELLQSLAQQTAVAMQLRDLAARTLQSAVLEERASLARELHDTLLQGFTGVTLQLRALLRRLPAGVDVQERLARIEAEATEAVQGARRAVGDMRGGSPVLAPVATEDLVTGISDLVRSCKLDTEAALMWQVKGKMRDLPVPVRIALLRITREAVGNALRHAEPETVSVILRYEPSHVELTVADDGRGFDYTEKATDHEGHFGLIGMRERAESAGGSFRIDTAPGKGTTINVKVKA